jgi:HAD superfamily hydrolase (TIGR01509 family)
MHKVFTPPLADADECRAVLRAGSRSFDWASVLLPRRVRRPATALYAFCRVADDAIDGDQQAVPALRDLRRRVDCMYAGRPAANPIDRELARVVREYDLPRVLLDAMLEGFAWDVQQRSYADLREVHAYSARVAGSVGAMMAVFMGARSYPQLARACDLGVAMQLTNIARDVGADARAGRLYLPQNWLAQAGVDVPALLSNPQFTPALEPVIRRLLRAADRLPIIMSSLTTAYDMVLVECGSADAQSIRRLIGEASAVLISVIDPAPELDRLLAALPGRKVIYTNGSVGHFERVAARLGVDHHFDHVYDIVASDYTPKPDPVPYDGLVALLGIDPTRTAMVEDMAKNLKPAADLGMTTVWLKSDFDWATDGADQPHVHHVAEDVISFLRTVVEADAGS